MNFSSPLKIPVPSLCLHLLARFQGSWSSAGPSTLSEKGPGLSYHELPLVCVNLESMVLSWIPDKFPWLFRKVRRLLTLMDTLSFYSTSPGLFWKCSLPWVLWGQTFSLGQFQGLLFGHFLILSRCTQWWIFTLVLPMTFFSSSVYSHSLNGWIWATYKCKYYLY